MGYICSYCKQSFTRCAFISHITEKKCSSAAAVNDSKQVLPNSLSSEHVQSKSSSKLKKGKDNAPKVLENGSLFMVVKLDDKKTPYEKIHKSASSSSGRHSGDSANVLHIGNKVKYKGKIYDFADFEDAVKKSNSGKVIVKSLQQSDFFTTFDYSSQYKITNKLPRPYLSEMVQVIFQRGSFDLRYKTSFTTDNLQTLSFLKAGYLKKKEVPKPSRRNTPRGVDSAKKVDILQKLVPLMPTNRHAFWINLPTSEEPDLTTELDVD